MLALRLFHRVVPATLPFVFCDHLPTPIPIRLNKRKLSVDWFDTISERDRLLATSQYWASVWRIRLTLLGVARQQPRFDDTKLEGVRLKFRSVRKAGDQAIDLRDAITGHQVFSEEPEKSAGFRIFFQLQLFKEAARRRRVVPGSPHVLSAEPVGLLFRAAQEFERGQRNRQSCSLPNRKPADPAAEDQRDRAVIGFRCLL